MSELDELMKKYYTDKCSLDHNYVPFYEELLNPIKNKKLKMLEIGIYRPPVDSVRQEAASLKTWYDYLPKAEIYAIDLDDFSNINNDRIKTFVCNHDSKEDLENLIKQTGSEFDIILEDGSHMTRSNQFIVGQLFKHVKSGGVYIIEDLHTSYIQHFLNAESTVKVLKRYISSGSFTSEVISEEDSKYISENIDRIEIKNGKISEIAFIYKK